MTWTPPELPEHVEVRKPRDDANKPHAHKVNRRDRLEIELMEQHIDSDMSEAEWMSLCTKCAGSIYVNQHTRRRQHSEDHNA